MRRWQPVRVRFADGHWQKQCVCCALWQRCDATRWGKYSPHPKGRLGFDNRCRACFRGKYL